MRLIFAFIPTTILLLKLFKETKQPLHLAKCGHFGAIEKLSLEKRIQINAALRALHTAGTCHANAATLAEIYVMKALGRFSLGQLQGAYHDLQFALRHAPSFALARELMQTPAMQALHRKHIAAPNRSKPAPMRAV